MTRKEQIKILDDKIEANNVQYEYEYLTKKDLGYKPDAVEKVKFEYSPIGKIFTDG